MPELRQQTIVNTSTPTAFLEKTPDNAPTGGLSSGSAATGPPSENPKKFGFSLDDQDWMDRVEFPSVDVPLADDERRTAAIATLKDFCLHVDRMINRQRGYGAWLKGKALQKLRRLPRTGPVDESEWIPKNEWRSFLRDTGLGQDTSELLRHIFLMYDAAQAKILGYTEMVDGYRATRRKDGTDESDAQHSESADHDWGPGDIGQIREAVGGCFKRVNPLCTSASPLTIADRDLQYAESAEKEIECVRRKLGELQKQIRQSSGGKTPTNGEDDDDLILKAITSSVKTISVAAESLGETDFNTLPDAATDDTQAVLKKHQESLMVSVAWIGQAQANIAELLGSSEGHSDE